MGPAQPRPPVTPSRRLSLHGAEAVLEDRVGAGRESAERLDLRCREVLLARGLGLVERRDSVLHRVFGRLAGVLDGVGDLVAGRLLFRHVRGIAVRAPAGRLQVGRGAAGAPALGVAGARRAALVAGLAGRGLARGGTRVPSLGREDRPVATPFGTEE